MTRDINLYIGDILEFITRIENDTHNMSEGEFSANYTVQDAVLRRLEIIGEAVKHLPKELKEKYPDVPWKDIAGTRDVLSHDYFGIELDTIWDTLNRGLPPLKEVMMREVEARRSEDE